MSSQQFRGLAILFRRFLWALKRFARSHQRPSETTANIPRRNLTHSPLVPYLSLAVCNNLDAGITQLANAGGGIDSDFTSGLSSEELDLAPGSSLSMTFQIGGLAPAPGALALLGLAGLAGGRRRRV